MSMPISGFTAVPNPIMLPFMALQSYFMMLLAGEAWQYGKRKISAMSNEDFNKLDIIPHMESMITSMEKAIPSIEMSMKNFTPLAKTITAEMVKTLPEIAKGFGEGITSIINPQSDSQFNNPTGAQLVRPETIPIAQSGLEGFNNFFQAMANIISNSRIAGTTGIVTDVKFGTTQKQEEIKQSEIRQQKFRDARQAEILAKIKREGENVRFRKISNVHQIIQAKNVREGVIIKRKAGQTQINARISLIKKITWAGRVIVSQRNMPGLLVGSKLRLKRLQLELVGLQQRYRF